MNILNFLTDLILDLIDIFETLKQKDEKILSKIICISITLGFIIASYKRWL